MTGTKRNGVTVLTPTDLEEPTEMWVTQMKTKVEQLTAQGCYKFILDMEICPNMTEKEVAILIHLRRCALERGGEIKLVHVRTPTHSLLGAIAAPKPWEIFPTVMEALESFTHTP